MKKLDHCLEPHGIESIEYSPGGAGEPGWFIYLKEGCSFDPMDKDDRSTFIPESDPKAAMRLDVWEHPGYKPPWK